MKIKIKMKNRSHICDLNRPRDNYTLYMKKAAK